MIDSCHCCELSSGLAPAPVFNRPGLSAIAYRIGTYTSFRQSLIVDISSAGASFVAVDQDPPLLRWKARTNDDYGMAVLEMWAYLADILTFYQERIANEAYLRPAVHRESVLRLAALLGYAPAPGMAASALLAFTLDKKKRLQVPVGLRSQSVPGPGEKPQKFETIEAVIADASLNKVRIFGQPAPYTALEENRDHAVLDPGLSFGSPLVPGDDLVVFGSAAQTVEEKRILSVVDADGQKTLTWAPAVKQAKTSPRMFRWRRKFRLYGQLVPAKFLVGTPKSEGSYEITWTEKEPLFDIAAGATSLNLDGVSNDIKPGHRLFVSAANTAQVVTVSAVAQVSDTLGQAPATVTRVSFSPAIAAAIPDRRLAVLYLLAEPELDFTTAEYPGTVSGNTIYVQATEVGDFVEDRRLILDDSLEQPQSAAIASSVVSSDGKHVALTLDAALTRPLDGGTAFLYGNIATATHGETVKQETLGNGDASATFQTFKLAKPPVTFVPKGGAPNGAGSTLEVRVDGVRWTERPTFYGAGPTDRVFVTSRDNEAVMTVRFGDGVTGARLTTGRSNIAAKYRYGLGSVGNVAEAAIRNLLDRPTGLRGVVNPSAAAGGADAETLDEARSNAPNTVRTFDRIVSLRDFEDYARQVAGVAKALAVVDWDGEEEAVYLTVAGDDGTVISGIQYQNLLDDLNIRRDPNRKMHMVPHVNVAVKVEAAIKVDPAHVIEDVQRAVEDALVAHFDFDNVGLGRAVHLSEVFASIQAVWGVLGSDVNRLQFKNAADRASHGATSAAVQPRLRIFRSELPFIADPDNDIEVSVGMP